MVTTREILREVARDIADEEAPDYKTWLTGVLTDAIAENVATVRTALLNDDPQRARQVAAYLAGQALELAARLRAERNER